MFSYILEHPIRPMIIFLMIINAYAVLKVLSLKIVGSKFFKAVMWLTVWVLIIGILKVGASIFA